MIPPDCQDCVSYTPIDDPERGLCRMHAPHSQVFLFVDDSGESVFQQVTYYPEVPAIGDGCGEFEPAIEL